MGHKSQEYKRFQETAPMTKPTTRSLCLLAFAYAWSRKTRDYYMRVAVDELIFDPPGENTRPVECRWYIG